MARCEVCFRHCELREGQTGPCGARAASGGEVRPLWYGRISSLALDPIEKKPLARFHPGSLILSAGGLGCNLHCPFCQNHEIAQQNGKSGFSVPAEEMPPSMELSRFDYPSFQPFLRSLAPEEYEHAPTVPPLAAPAPDPDVPAEKSPGNVYYNPYGGRYFHVNPECSSVSPKYFPLTAITMDDISSGKSNLLPCPYCTLQDRVTPSPVPIMAPSGTNVGKSILRAAAPAYGDNGLTTLMILMNTPERQAFILESFPPYCYLDADYDGNVIRIIWYPEMNFDQETPQEPHGERWSLTFEFIENTWQLTSATNGRDWTARAEHNVYTFDDYHDHSGVWLWSAAFETRLTEFDYAGLKDLVEMYSEAMPDRPSLR